MHRKKSASKRSTSIIYLSFSFNELSRWQINATSVWKVLPRRGRKAVTSAWEFVSPEVSVLNGFERNEILEASYAVLKVPREFRQSSSWESGQVHTVGERLILLGLLIIAESFGSNCSREGQYTLNIHAGFSFTGSSSRNIPWNRVVLFSAA